MIAALTPREREVMELVRDRLTNKEIAYRLGITEGTTAHHLEAASRKLGATGLGRWEAAERYALLSPRRPEPRRRKVVQAESLGLELV